MKPTEKNLQEFIYILTMQLYKRDRFQNIIKRLLFLFDRYGDVSYAQEGEDMILKGLFHGKRDGFYIDVGAYHPKRFSNTCYLYKYGWRGINIDANQETVDLFNKLRSDDQNICAAISNVNKKVMYYEFEEGAVNTVVKEFANKLSAHGVKPKKQHTVNTYKLDQVLEKCSVPEMIDLLSVDVEGHCLEVLKSNNWKKYSPRIVLVEDDDFSYYRQSKIHKYLISKEYIFIARTTRTSLYSNEII